MLLKWQGYLYQSALYAFFSCFGFYSKLEIFNAAWHTIWCSIPGYGNSQTWKHLLCVLLSSFFVVGCSSCNNLSFLWNECPNMLTTMKLLKMLLIWLDLNAHRVYLPPSGIHVFHLGLQCVCHFFFHLIQSACSLRDNGPVRFSVMCLVSQCLLKLYYGMEEELM